MDKMYASSTRLGSSRRIFFFKQSLLQQFFLCVSIIAYKCSKIWYAPRFTFCENTTKTNQTQSAHCACSRRVFGSITSKPRAHQISLHLYVMKESHKQLQTLFEKKYSPTRTKSSQICIIHVAQRDRQQMHTLLTCSASGLLIGQLICKQVLQQVRGQAIMRLL